MKLTFNKFKILKFKIYIISLYEKFNHFKFLSKVDLTLSINS